jgi:hypothetical protein
MKRTHRLLGRWALCGGLLAGALVRGAGQTTAPPPQAPDAGAPACAPLNRIDLLPARCLLAPGALPSALGAAPSPGLRPLEFTFSGASNSFLTPNGDALNDDVVFSYSNPRDSSVAGKVFDLRGSEVSGMTHGPGVNQLRWDARSAGALVPGGIYIYSVESEGRTYRGTLVVIR